jgi:hypothetical protein
MATLEETLRSLGLSAARGIPQLATGFVDLAALPFTATGLLKPEQAVGSTAYLTSKGLLPPEQQGLLNQTTELVSSAMNPAVAAKAALAKGGLLAAGTITAGPSWMGKKIPSVEKLAKNQGKFLYHSDTAKNLENLKYGIDPQQGGNWVREIAKGATDDVEGLLANQTPMAWFSDKPEWVQIKVARELNKPLSEVTINDIKKHGHLAIINKKDPYLKDIWKVGETGLSEGGYSKVENLKGEKIPAYQTNMYQEGNYGQRMEPFGIERNEWVSTQSVEPLLQLTGDNLVKYLQLTGILKK